MNTKISSKFINAVQNDFLSIFAKNTDDRKYMTEIDGVSVLVIRETGRPRWIWEMNEIALKQPRLWEDSLKNVMVTNYGFLLFPYYETHFNQITEDKILKNKNADILNELIGHTEQKKKQLKSFIIESEGHLYKKEWDKINIKQLIRLRAEYKACDLDKYIPENLIDQIVQKCPLPPVFTSKQEAKILLFSPKMELSTVFEQECDTLCCASVQIINNPIHLKEETKVLLDQFGSHKIMIQRVNKIRQIEEERRIKQSALIKYWCNALRQNESNIPSNIEILLEFPSIAFDFNESNHHFKRRVAHILEVCFNYTGLDPINTSSQELIDELNKKSG